MKPAGQLVPLAPAEDLLVRSARRTAARDFTFDVIAAADPAAPLAHAHLTFPGFASTALAEVLPGGGLRFRGGLPGPGFYPLSVSADGNGRRLTGRDYFVVPDDSPAPAGHEAGYYVFLGCGDYPIITGRETHPLAAWTLAQWKDLVAWMGAHGMNRLWVLVNGYTLAYPSQRYPLLRDRHARNVSDNFLGELIAHGHAHGVQTHLMLTTDGHARDFSRAHPEAARLDADGKPCHHFGLALEHPLTRRYIFDVLDEVLALYPAADGVAVHPTESDPDRFNPESLAAFRAETGHDLREAPPAERRAWHNRTFARFMAEFTARCHRHNPALTVTMANCWWQDDFVAINHEELPVSVQVAVWHYAWEDTAPAQWPIYRWTEAFDAGRILYVPTSQSYLYPTEPSRVMDRHIGTDRLISTAATLGVRRTVYFAGWDIADEPARLLDAALVRHPTGGPVPDLYADYFAAKARRLSAPSQP
ncbi:MAG: hypothetical protein JSS11_12510 [Verrucomicrobia bacterium]|nr:hypothetical protein [Verrucomicrobiota bacterium]